MTRPAIVDATTVEDNSQEGSMQSGTAGYERPAFAAPLPGEYIYAGWSIDPPVRTPVVRRSSRRADVLNKCRAMASKAGTIADVANASVFESVFIPPLAGVPRFDVLMLIRAATAEASAQVRASTLWRELYPEFVITARNVRRIGDTELTRSATFLFNHFTADDPARAVVAWEDISGWYTTKIGVDNSTLLQPSSDAPYALINYVRLPGSGVRFVLAQVTRPSFYSHVRRTLRANGMVALPILCKSTVMNGATAKERPVPR